MPFPIAAAIAGGAMMEGIFNGISNNNAKEVADMQIKAQNKMMDKQQKYNNANSVNAYANAVQGAKLAGLNPAMMGQTNPQAATVSQGTAAKAENVELNAANALTLAQAKQIEAETAKTDAETQAIQNTNDEWNAANDAAKTGIMQDFNTEIEDLEKTLKNTKPDTENYNKISGRINEVRKMRDRLSDDSYRGAVGILKGTSAARGNTKERMGILTEFLNGVIDRSVALKKLDNGTVDALAEMPTLTKNKLAKDIKHVDQMIAESESKEKLNDQTVNLMAKQIEKIGQDILDFQLSNENYVRFMAEFATKEVKDKDGNVIRTEPDEAKRELYKKHILNNLTDTEKRKWAYDTGSKVISGVATGGTAGAIMGAGGKLMNGTIKKKSGMDQFDDYIKTGQKIRTADQKVGPYQPYKTPLPKNTDMDNYFKKYHKRGFPNEDEWNSKYGW